ncbi:prolipoprotein diacylglyceryl transferase [Oceanicaulis sp.]|uniref:prolipoprotein diacylglyceryl transferase n=1 Tax=Oceanicaulis sp. TaxID=1924941 RepID=UPI003F6EE433
MIGACPASFDLIDPVLFSIPEIAGLGPFPIRWYALAYIAGLFIGLYWVLRLVSQGRLWGLTPKTQTAPYSRAFVDDLVLWIMIGIIGGGRLGYVLFYNTSMIWEEPVRVVTGITDGGMSFHGGLLGVTLAMVFTARAYKAPLLRVSDAVAAATPIGLFFGRLANFINGELWGRPAPDLPWAMRFSADPTCQLRHPSQLYEAALEGVVLFVILTVLIYRFRALSRPGLLTGAFLAGYGVFRAFVEVFREPDRQMPEALQGYVTMGMVLCIPMIAAGAYLVWRARKNTAVGARKA